MKNIRSFFAAISIAFVLAACNFNATYTNDEEDKKEAEKIINDFYNAVIAEDYATADAFFSPKFFAASPKDSLHRIFDRTKQNLGEFKSNKLLEWNTREIKGTDKKTEYVLVYEVEYSKHKATETISMLKEGEETTAKIVGYNINSPGFLKWN